MRLTLRILFHLSPFSGIDFLSLEIKKCCNRATRRQHDLTPKTFFNGKEKESRNLFKLEEQCTDYNTISCKSYTCFSFSVCY